MGHLNGILARVGGNLNNNLQKSQMPGRGGHVEASIRPIHKLTEVKYLMHIIISNDVPCFDGKKLKGWVYSHLSDQIRQDIHSLTDNSQNL